MEKPFAIISMARCGPCQALERTLSEEGYTELNAYASVPEENGPEWKALAKLAQVLRVPALVDVSEERIVASGFQGIIHYLTKYHEDASNTQTSG